MTSAISLLYEVPTLWPLFISLIVINSKANMFNKDQVHWSDEMYRERARNFLVLELQNVIQLDIV